MSPEQVSLLPEPGHPAHAFWMPEALRPREGHWDELHAAPVEAGQLARTLASPWQRFWAASHLSGPAELDARQARVRRRVQEDGARYTVYAQGSEEGAPAAGSQVWPLALLPLLVPAAEWRRIEAGVKQRAKLLNAVLADLYGPRELLQRSLLPASLVLAHPQFLRAMHGCRPPGGVHLHVVAFDLARGPDGLWWVVGQRTQAPSGLGYMLQNRLTVAEQFPEAFRALAVQRLAGAFRVLVQGLVRLAEPLVEGGQSPHLVLLTPGPANETYFEQAFLARYLGLALVEGGDLTVRGRRVFLKTLHGLQRVHGILRRVDDEYLDPLELRPDSQLGVPGLVDALRAGEVVVANAPGSGWLESPGLDAFWPGVAEALLGESLSLPSSRGWWCGEAAAWQRERQGDRLAQYLVAPTFPGGASQTFAADELSPSQLAQLRERIDHDPAAFTLKTRVRPSKQPLWTGRCLEPRAALLRVYALSDGLGGWRVLPGGLTRIAAQRGVRSPDALLSLQAGAASVDTWVLTEGAAEVDRSTLLPPPLQPDELARTRRTVTSRSAEHLFWLGRYTERAENTLRLARHSLLALAASERAAADAPLALHGALKRLALRHGLVHPPAPTHARELRREILQQLGDPKAYSLAHTLRRLLYNAQQLRERLSSAHWGQIERLVEDFEARFVQALAGGELEVQALLAACDLQLAALTGGQLDRMTRDDGWRLLSVGRQIERLDFQSDMLLTGLQQGLTEHEEGFSLLLALADSTITYRAQFQSRRELAPLVQLLLMDRDNPRALAWVAGTLRERLLKAARHEPVWATRVADELPHPDDWSLAALLREPALLQALLQQCGEAAQGLSVQIGQKLFAHAQQQQVWQ